VAAMQFKTRKIRYKKRKPLSSLFKKKKDTNKKRKVQIGIVLGIIFAVVLFFYGCSALVSKIGFINIIGIFGESLETDSYGNTNILMLGTGGKGHDGKDLTDTIILASIDYKNNIAPMISIPRDFYVNLEELGGGTRINRVYEMGKDMYDSKTGLELEEKAVEDITGIDVHYYLKIDFDGFKDIVDSLGGVDIYVDEAIYDPYYPLDGTIKYQTFSLPAGMQHMDGETALKYARSRKTTSDFDRSKRQQKLLFAIKNKAMSKDILLNPGKIKNLYSAVSDHIETNLSLRHIIELAKLSKDFNQENIVNKVITDDPTSCGGFLYVPERELFGGAYVLVPIGNHYDFIHQYVDLSLHYPELAKDPIKIQILNGTKTPGLAAETKAMLKRLCFDVTRFGNARNQEIDQTTLYYKSEEPPEALYFIKQLIPGAISAEIPEIYSEPQYISDAELILELGEDYASTRPEDVFYLYYPQQTTTSPDEDDSEETTEAQAEE
jgi:LCP family protein required for cell wall assembly